jgi:hypothetical protein
MAGRHERHPRHARRPMRIRWRRVALYLATLLFLLSFSNWLTTQAWF